MNFDKIFHQSEHTATKILTPILTVLHTALEYYQYHLTKEESAKFYLAERGIDLPTIDKFQIGFSPNGYNQLTSQKNNIVWQTKLQRTLESTQPKGLLSDTLIDLMELSGLLREDNSGTLTDRFRGRIVVPIKDEYGQTVSFGGRVFNPDFSHSNAPKYINGSDTLCFKKKDIVFGLNLLDKNKKYPFINVTEGYMDVISMEQFGIKGTVCGMGTSITKSQLEKIFKYTNHIRFCFDGDNAGRKAADRAAKTIIPLLSGTRTASFAFLPDGEDPDSLLRQGLVEYTEQDFENGREYLYHCLDEAISIDSMLEALAITKSDATWETNPSLIIAHLLQDISCMPNTSNVANDIRTKIQIHANQHSRARDGISHNQMVNFVKNMV